MKRNKGEILRRYSLGAVPVLLAGALVALTLAVPAAATSVRGSARSGPMPAARRGAVQGKLMPAARRGAVTVAAAGCPVGATPPPGSAACIEGIPHFSHVITVVFENKSRDEIWNPGYISATNMITPGTPTMATQPVTSNTPNPYLNSLVPTGAFMQYYYGAGHFSFDNYLSMTLGQTPNPTTQDDCPNYYSCVMAETNPISTPGSGASPGGGYSVADQLERNGYTWKGYMDSMPAPCTHASSDPANPATYTQQDPYVGGNALGDYADRHNPFIYLPPIVKNQARCQSHVVPYTDTATTTGLMTDIAHDTVPNYAFVSPDTCNDGHDVPFCGPVQHNKLGGLVAVDQWLQSNIQPIIDYVKAHNGILFLVWDESDIRTKTGDPFPNNDFGPIPVTSTIAPVDLAGCCSGNPRQGDDGGLIGALAISPLIQPGLVSTVQHDHASLLRTIEDSFGFKDATGAPQYLGDAGSPLEQGHAMTELFTAPAANASATPSATLVAPQATSSTTPSAAPQASSTALATSSPPAIPANTATTVSTAPTASPGARPSPTTAATAPSPTTGATPSGGVSTATATPPAIPPPATSSPIPAAATATPPQLPAATATTAPTATGVTLLSPTDTTAPASGGAPGATSPSGAGAGAAGAATATTAPGAGQNPAARTAATLVASAVQAGARLSLSPGMVKPGGTVTVRGSGFGCHEGITLALNGAALTTSPTVITTGADGAFAATFVAPSSLLRGANTVSAIGGASRGAARAPLDGILSVVSHYYFTGGVSTAADASTVVLLNPNRAAATARLTIFYANGATTTASVAIGPASLRLVPLAGLERRAVPRAGVTRDGQPLGLYLAASRPIAAQFDIARRGKDGDALLGAAGAGTRWYLAEGYTGLSFHEKVSILNPDDSKPAHVRLALLPADGRAARTVPVTVPAHTNGAVDIGRLMPGRALGILTTSDRPVVVERTLTFAGGGYGMTARAGVNNAAASWLFAEGTTTNGFETYLTILNPGDRRARVTASFFGRSGVMLGHITRFVAARTRATLALNRLVHASGFASVVMSDHPVVVERPEYIGPPNARRAVAGSDVFGRNGTGVKWSFPGGDNGGKNTFLLIYNPAPATLAVDLTLYDAAGHTLTRRVYVPPTARYTFNVRQLAPRFAAVNGAVLQSVDGRGFVAEQTVFAPNRSTLRSTEGLAQ